MKKGKEVKVVYQPSESQSEEGRQMAERQYQAAWNSLFDLLLKDEGKKK